MPDASVAEPALLRRVALSSLLGTAIEYYDFLVYGTMSALVFGLVFFPDSSPAAATIAAFGTLAAGYLARRSAESCSGTSVTGWDASRCWC